MDLGIDSRTALVIGGSSGIGQAVARSLLDEGAKVVVVSRHATQRQGMNDLLARYGDDLAVYDGDYAQPDRLMDVVARASERMGVPSILVASSGGPPLALAQTVQPDVLQATLQTNLGGIIAVVLKVLPAMLAQRWGRIVIVTTTGVKQPAPNLVYSNIARSGVSAYAKTLANEVAGQGVTVNTVMPGKILTDRLRQITQATAKDNGITVQQQEVIDFAQVPAGRYGEPQEIADMISFLASERASYVTGSHIAVDGGSVRS